MGLVSVLRERRSSVELRVELDRARAREAVMKSAAAAFAACVQALILDIEELGPGALRAELSETLARALDEKEPATPATLRKALGACEKHTLEYAEEERRWLEARDAELRRIIDVLGAGLGALAAGNAAHHDRVLARGTRLEAASQLGDLVKMRQAISREVNELRVAVEQQRAEDHARASELGRQVTALRSDLESANTKAATDPLTGAANRASFEAEMARRGKLAAAGGEGHALIVIDVDHFKRINDTHGHAVGDRVLMGLVGFCRQHIRRGDTLARWGGEELAIVLPGASARVAQRKARALCAELASRTWTVEGGIELSFTVSAGVSAWRDGDTPTVLFERADKALYAAKHGGRNRVCVET